MTEYQLSLLATEHLERNKAVIAGFNLKYGQGRKEPIKWLPPENEALWTLLRDPRATDDDIKSLVTAFPDAKVRACDVEYLFVNHPELIDLLHLDEFARRAIGVLRLNEEIATESLDVAEQILVRCV
jgi:hypothetical protein